MSVHARRLIHLATCVLGVAMPIPAFAHAAAADTDEIELDFHFPDWKTVPIVDHDLGGGSLNIHWPIWTRNLAATWSRPLT